MQTHTHTHTQIYQTSIHHWQKWTCGNWCSQVPSIWWVAYPLKLSENTKCIQSESRQLNTPTYQHSIRFLQAIETVQSRLTWQNLVVLLAHFWRLCLWNRQGVLHKQKTPPNKALPVHKLLCFKVAHGSTELFRIYQQLLPSYLSPWWYQVTP